MLSLTRVLQILIVAALQPFMLSGCGGGSEAATITPPPGSPPPPPPPPSADQTPPQVDIVSPAGGASLGAPVTLIASATDASGISTVRFFANDTLIEEISQQPYEAQWSPTPGTYSVRVEAVDSSPAANEASTSRNFTIVDVTSGIPAPGQWQEQDFATVLDVGPGMGIEELEDLPWETVGADTLIRVHWRAAPYRAKWVVNAAGTLDNPIVITGVPNSGQLPVVSGDDAVTRAQLDYSNSERSIIKIGGADTPSANSAEWVFIENLDIRGANSNNQFRDSSGQQRTYASNAASIHVNIGSNIYIRNNVLSDSGNGLFSGFQSANLVISGNRFEGNGNSGSGSQHNSYTESLGIIYEYNYFLPLRAGATGNNLKDRSAGTVIRYNWIESGARELDLVDSDHSNIYNAPTYGETFVYGNILIEPSGSNNQNIIHYGGDLSGRESTYRKGMLHLYNNTIISYRGDRMVLLGMSSNDEAADVRNNLLYSPQGGNTIAITSGRGMIDLRGNWLQSGWDISSETLTGAVNDLGNTEGSNPGFADEASMNFRLTNDSTAVNVGVGLDTAASSLPVTNQYQEHASAATRPVAGNLDAGAFEFDGQVAPPMPSVDTSALPNAEVNASYSETLQASGGSPPYAWSVSAGMLPAGLTLSAAGTVSGTPTATETQVFTVTVTDDQGQQDDAQLSLSVVDPAPPGNSSLDGYSSASALTSLSYVSADLSGIAYVPDTNTFFLIQNNGGLIWEVDTSFNRLRTIQMNGFGDTEDLVHLGGTEFAIVDESSQLYIGTISAATTQVSAGDFQRVLFDNYSGNSGYEGVAYDRILQTFYVVKETSPKRIRSFLRPATSADTMVTAQTPFDADQLPAGDLSSVRLDDRTGRLLILSHESHKLMDVGLDGFVHGELQMADSSQHEGVALDSSYNIYVTSEPRHYRVYSQ